MKQRRPIYHSAAHFVRKRSRARRQEPTPGRLRLIATAFAQDDAAAARIQRRRLADQLRPKLPKLASTTKRRLSISPT
jgi:hypothetical protein